MRLVSIFVAALLAGFVSASAASDHGCTCLLCLANPNGPRAVSECKPPIDKLFRDLAKGRSFPTCDMAQGPGGKSYAAPGQSYFDMCPSGTTALSAGAQAIQGTGDIQPMTYTGPLYVGIGSGDDWWPSGEAMAPTKVCVGKAVGQTTVWSGTGDFQMQTTVTIYDSVALLDMQASPRVIDVYIDSALYRRVRW